MSKNNGSKRGHRLSYELTLASSVSRGLRQSSLFLIMVFSITSSLRMMRAERGSKGLERMALKSS